MYLDLTGERVVAAEAIEGRRWILESAELIALRHYRRSRQLGLGSWLNSLRGDRELATFSFTDPAPFAVSMRVLVRDTLRGRLARAVGSPADPERLKESAELSAI
jgi:predicted ATP-grasp superfamily ATP-dependent carboligase